MMEEDDSRYGRRKQRNPRRQNGKSAKPSVNPQTQDILLSFVELPERKYACFAVLLLVSIFDSLSSKVGSGDRV